MSIRGECMIPQPLSNKAFRSSFTGLIDAGLGVYVNFNQMNLGLGGRYKQFQVMANKVSSQVNTIQMVYGGFGVIGFDLYKTENIFFTGGMNIGYNLIEYSSIKCKNHIPNDFIQNALSWELFFKTSYLLDDGVGIGFMVALNAMNFVFNPEDICLDEYKAYDEGEKDGLTSTLSFGFCISYDWSKKKNTYTGDDF